MRHDSSWDQVFEAVIDSAQDIADRVEDWWESRQGDD